MNSLQFVERLNEISLHYALGDLPTEEFFRQHEKVVFSQIAYLLEQEENKELDQYKSEIFMAALSPDDNRWPAGFEERLDKWMFGGLSSHALLRDLEGVRFVQDNYKLSVSLGILCVDQDGRVVFEKFFDRKTDLPIEQPERRPFRLQDNNQQVGRIPLIIELPDGTLVDHQPAIEFPLWDGITNQSPFVVFLLPVREAKYIRVGLEWDSFFTDGELPSRGFLDKYTSRNPDPPVEATALDSVIKRCLGFLNWCGDTLTADLHENLMNAVLAACKVLRAQERKLIERYRIELIDHLQRAGPAAKGFFAVQTIEYFNKQLPEEDRTRFADRAEQLKQALMEAISSEDNSESAKVVEELTGLAISIIALAMQKGSAIDADQMKAFVELALPPAEQLLYKAASGAGIAPIELARRLPLFLMARPLLVEAAMELLYSSEEFKLPEDVAKELQTITAALSDSRNDQHFLEKFSEFIEALNRAGPMAEGFLYYKAIQQTAESLGAEDRREILAKATAHLEALKDASFLAHDGAMARAPLQELATETIVRRVVNDTAEIQSLPFAAFLSASGLTDAVSELLRSGFSRLLRREIKNEIRQDVKRIEQEQQKLGLRAIERTVYGAYLGQILQSIKPGARPLEDRRKKLESLVPSEKKKLLRKVN